MDIGGGGYMAPSVPATTDATVTAATVPRVGLRRGEEAEKNRALRGRALRAGRRRANMNSFGVVSEILYRQKSLYPEAAGEKTSWSSSTICAGCALATATAYVVSRGCDRIK